MPPNHWYHCAGCQAPMVPVVMVYACRVRACPYGREGKGKRTWTLDDEGKGKGKQGRGKGNGKCNRDGKG